MVENNKLIAEFMGWKTHPIYGKDYVINKDKSRKVPYWSDISYESDRYELAYNVSWDWLMPVVGRIYNLDDYYDYILTSGQFSKEIKLSININHVYDQIIGFIKYYNEKERNDLDTK